ncbi:hypothetical protein HYPSUDRAFT_98245, partial [Hypholoma sublateritium FD-334 SS-4]
DAADSFDAPKCHPDTRTAVLCDIREWIAQAASQTERTLWLHGAAGAGKSAIARSIVQHCLDAGIPIARFFFFRADPTRNKIGPVVATLVVQLIAAIPELHPVVVAVIHADPLIFDKSLETQLSALVFAPLCELRRTARAHAPLVLLLDGVDECTERAAQARLVTAVGAVLRSCAYPVRVLFASRAEPHLLAAFREPCIAGALRSISLDDDDYAPGDDIRRFVRAAFAHIHTTHPLGDMLGAAWPPRAAVEGIVSRSSGQFVFAAVAMRF